MIGPIPRIASKDSPPPLPPVSACHCTATIERTELHPASKAQPLAFTSPVVSLPHTPEHTCGQFKGLHDFSSPSVQS